MKIVCSPDSFKESMSAAEAARCMAEGIRRVAADAECVEIPLSDGGEGFSQALIEALCADVRQVAVQGPLGETVQAQLGISGNKAIIEVAQAIGLDLIPPNKRRIRKASTYGVGQLISAALDVNSTEILVGLGGSATNDGGAGMLRALGLRFFDSSGNELDGSPESLIDLDRIDVSGFDKRLHGTKIKVACDVNNPLLGDRGASAVYGPQKGASADDVKFLDAALTRFATVGGGMRGTAKIEGAGAAGGLGYAFLTYLGGQLNSGVEIVLEAVDFSAALENADFVFTGEGAMDRQTLMGKTLSGVAREANAAGVPLIGFAGKIDVGAAELYNDGFVVLMPIIQTVSTLEEALVDGKQNLTDAAERTTRLLHYKPQKVLG